MKKIIAFAAALFFAAAITTNASAQEYNHAAGVRIGASSGAFTYKQPLDANAIEAMLWVNWNSGFSLAGLYEWSMPVITNGFNLYYGAGAHLGVFSQKFALGLDVILGLEYKIPSVPFAVSFDYKPSISLLPSAGVDFVDFAIGIKFTF